MKKLHLMLLLSIFFKAGAQENLVKSPEWTKDLIIYEIATKSFTSPNGPGSGTFNSTREKIPYLKELGINAIWLAGYSLAHPSHYYNIWTQYACYNPRILDPGLGTEEDFRNLIRTAHDNGIKVFLDVITHAVMNESELVEDHPHWFGEKSPIWHMTLYNWKDRIEELDNWWVDTWVNYVTEFGVDGFRLDLSGQRHDLWREIRRRSAETGHPIVLFSEGEEFISGIYDFNQAYLKTVATHGVEQFTLAKDDMAKYVLSKFGRETDFSVLITYSDDQVIQYFTGVDKNDFILLDDQSDQVSFWRTDPDGLADRHFLLRLDQEKEVKSIQIKDTQRGIWHYPVNGRNYVIKVISGSDGYVRLVLPVSDSNRPEGIYASNEFSCHDNGWEGSPANRNPFIAEGSRALFGYAALFAPAIPLFMSGEEFNCNFRALPNLSPHLHGGARPGEGTWLYGNWIDWTQLQIRDKQEMFNDVKRMIALRKEYADILTSKQIHKTPDIAPVAIVGKGGCDLPVPYVQWNENRAIVVAANPGTSDVDLLLCLSPEDTFGWDGVGNVTITDLWNNSLPYPVKLSAHGSVEIPVRITADKQSSGGIAVILITR